MLSYPPSMGLLLNTFPENSVSNSINEFICHISTFFHTCLHHVTSEQHLNIHMFVFSIVLTVRVTLHGPHGSSLYVDKMAALT